MHDTVAELTINGLIIIPFTIHPVLQTPLVPKLCVAPLIAQSASYSDIVNYNTISHASFFLKIFRRPSLRCSHGAVSPCHGESPQARLDAATRFQLFGVKNGRRPSQR